MSQYPTEPGQQPYYPYQQPPQYPPPPMLPKKKSRKTLFIVIGLIAAFVFVGCIGASVLASQAGQKASQQSSVTQAAQQPTQAQSTPTAIPPTPKPTLAPKWTITHTFSGNGTKKTGFFTVPNDWKLVWKCNPSSDYFGSYNVIIGVTGSDGTPIDPAAVNTICKTGNTGDFTDEHQGGQIYLDVNSEGSWTIQVQELK
jgi:hypothetical protein